jgi:hypothetical protein
VFAGWLEWYIRVDSGVQIPNVKSYLYWYKPQQPTFSANQNNYILTTKSDGRADYMHHVFKKVESANENDRHKISIHTQNSLLYCVHYSLVVLVGQNDLVPGFDVCVSLLVLSKSRSLLKDSCWCY